MARGPRRAPPTESAFEAAKRRIVARVRDSEEFDAADQSTMKAPERNSAQYCLLGVRVLNALLASPQPDQGVALRGILLYTSD